MDVTQCDSWCGFFGGVIVTSLLILTCSVNGA